MWRSLGIATLVDPRQLLDVASKGLQSDHMDGKRAVEAAELSY